MLMPRTERERDEMKKEITKNRRDETLIELLTRAGLRMGGTRTGNSEMLQPPYLTGCEAAAVEMRRAQSKEVT